MIRNLICLAFLLTAPAWSFQYRHTTHPNQPFELEFNDTLWEMVPNGSQNKPLEAVDKTMAERTLATFQRRVADEKYHARFSVVADPLTKFKGTATEKLIQYQKHAVEFMKGQRFHIIEVKSVELPKAKYPAFEILANQRDFGLYFRQVALIVGEEAYLLTAAARTDKFPGYKAEIDQFFNTFALSATHPGAKK